MPTECERKSALLGAQNLDQNHHHHHDQEIRPQAREPATQQTTTTVMNDNLEIIEEGAGIMAVRSPSVDSMSQTSIASPTTETPTTNGLKGSTNGSGESKRTSLTSPDPTSYVTKARVTRPIPPPPSYNPMQFVQIKPCNLYQSAQEQLKKAEEVKKIKEIKKEEPEEWQNNLDNWKSSRRKRVEHIIDRVVEVKKLELEEHDRSRRKSKTFSEMIEERGERAGRTKLKSLAVYNEDEANDLSDLGIGTSSASGKSSLSEDYDNNSVTSDNPELDKAIQNENNHYQATSVQPREYIASPGYETSSSTAPASSPDPCEYTYEGAIQDYKQRISRAASATSSGNYKPPSGSSNNPNNHVNNSNGSYNNPGESDGTKLPPNTLNLSGGISNKNNGEIYSPRRGNKIEDRLLSFEVTSPSDHQEGVEKLKVDVPKIDILKRKEIFESQEKSQQNGVHGQSGNLSTSSSSNAIDVTGGAAPKVTLRDRFKYESNASSVDQSSKKDMRRLSGDVTSIRERLQSLEQQKDTSGERRTVDIPVPPLKDRLSSLQNAVKKEEIKKPPVVLVDARQLEIMKNEEETAKQRKLESTNQITYKKHDQVDDSGILSNGQEDVKLEEKRLQKKEQEDQLNAAIAALALEEKQLEEAANAVNKIEAEFEEIATPASTNNSDSKSSSNSNGNSNATTNQTSQLPYEMDFSINEALELALEAIDKEETNLTANVEEDEQRDDEDEDANVQASSSSSSKEIKIENRNEMETSNQINKIKRINQSNTGKKESSSMMTDEAEIAVYVPQKATNQIEPIYENVASVTTATTMMTTSIAHSVIIPNGAKTSNDNNNDNNKHHELHNHHHNHYESNPHQHMHQQQQQQQQQPNHHNQNNSSSNQSNQNNYNNSINNKNICFDSITTTTKTTTTTTTTQLTNVPQMTNNQTMIITPIETKDQSNQKQPIQPAPVSSHRIEETVLPTNKQHQRDQSNTADVEPYYQVPKSSEPYYDAPKHLRPVPLYENIEVFYNGLETISALSGTALANGFALEPPKEKPPPPPAESPPPITTNDTDESVNDTTDTWSSSDNTYETISTRHSHSHPHAAAKKNNADHPSPPIKRINSTKRIKKELRNKRSSFLGIDSSNLDDEDHYLEMTVAPPPDMAQFLQQERQLEKQLYMKAAGLCDSSDTGESRDSGVSENHSRQSSEHYTNSSEENERHIDVDISVETYHHHDSASIVAAQTPLLQTVKGDSAESWTESATAAAAATQSLTEATATANAKMLSIEEKIREQEEVLRVERELLQLEQEELKRQRENLMLRENMARRELQHGAKMLMSANRRSLQELNGNVKMTAMPPAQQQIYANVPSIQQQYYQMDIDYRKSMSDLNEFNPTTLTTATKRAGGMLPPTPPTKPLRAMHIPNGRPLLTHAHPHQPQDDYVVMTANQRFGGSLVKIAAPAPLPTAAPRSHIYSNFQHRSQQNLCSAPQVTTATATTGTVTATATAPTTHPYHGNMTRNTLHALSATPKPKYTDGWVLQQQQHQSRNSLNAASHLANDPAWLSAYQQKRKSMPDTGSAFSAYNGNHWLVQEAEQRRIAEEQRRSLSNGSTPLHQKSNGKPLPDAIIQTLTERVQSKGIGERKRLDNFKATERSPLHAAATYQQQQSHYTTQHHDTFTQPQKTTAAAATASQNPQSNNTATTQDKVLSVSGKKKCSHCGDELGRGAAMIIESLLLFYHINCFKCCVCHVQLGDGLNGTDVRVRNHKLHCQNCYSSDDGIKFSCV